MAKDKKSNASGEPTAQLAISIEQFVRTRDSVIVSLTNLQKSLTQVQNGVNEMLYAYMKHTSSMLAGEPAALEGLNLGEISATIKSAVEATPASNVFSNVADLIATPIAATSTPAAPTTENGPKRKRKREKKERDPNAPKRPLTAAFLYSSQARPIVRKELEEELKDGQKLEPNAVNAEVTKRWNAMPEEDKELWKQSYRDSMETYKEEMKSYLTEKGVTEAVHLDDEEGSDEAEAGAVDTEADGSDSDDEAAAPAKVPTPPANTKTPRTTKRQKTAAAAAAATNGTHLVPIAPQITPSAVPIPLPQAKSAASILPPGTAPAESTPAKKGAKKDKKGQKAAATPATPAAKEASPEDAKKTTVKKSGRQTRNAEAEAETPAEPKDTKKKRERKRKSEGATA